MHYRRMGRVMGPYRFDPDGLGSMAGKLALRAVELRELSRATAGALVGVGRSSRSVAILAGTAAALAARADDLRSRMISLTEMQINLPAPAEELGALWDRIASFDGSDNDPRLDGWLRRSVPLEDDLARWLAGARPAEVAQMAGELNGSVGARLAYRHAGLVAGTDGLPSSWRGPATRLLISDEVERLRAERSGFGMWLEDVVMWPRRSERDRLDDRIATLEGWLASDRVFLAFDPGGDGLVVEVVGDLETADHVAIVVPGIGTTIDNFDGWVADPAGRLAGAADLATPDEVAVVAWLGYDAPLGPGANLDGATRDNARAGAPLLRSFVDGVRAVNRQAAVTVVAHSYGSVVSGWAARDDILDVDRLVLVGSPNIPAASAGELGLAGRVFVGEAPGDPVVWLGEITDGLFPILGHGWDPGDCDEFGAPVFETDAESWLTAHSSYLSGSSATTIGRIVVGDTTDLELICQP